MDRVSGLLLIAGSLFFLWLYDTGRWAAFESVLLGKQPGSGPLAPAAIPAGYTLVAGTGTGTTAGTNGEVGTGSAACQANWTPGCPSNHNTGSNTLNSVLDIAGGFGKTLLGFL